MTLSDLTLSDTPNAALTDELKQFARDEGFDLFGIANIDHMNERARPGRRPMDLYPYARSVMIIGCGIMDPFCRGWVKNGKARGFFSLTLLELERRVRLLKRFFREKGYHTFGGEVAGNAVAGIGLRLAEPAADCGMGYVGKSNLLITPRYGPRQNLISLATDAVLIPDKSDPLKNAPLSGCGSCTLCQKMCLSGAIMGDGYFHARQCESIINAQPNKRYYNENVNQDCDRCLRYCPKGQLHWRKGD